MEIHFGPIRGCHVAPHLSANFFKLAPWPIRSHQPLPPYLFSCTPPLSVSVFSLLSSPLSRDFPLPFDCRPIIRVVHAPDAIGKRAANDQTTEVSAPDDEWWSLRRLWKIPPSSPFLANSGIFRPYFMARPPVLEQAFNSLQNRAPLDRRIITIEKSITIHTMSSTTFLVNRGSFVR